MKEIKSSTCKVIGLFVYRMLTLDIQEAKCFEFTVQILPLPPRFNSGYVLEKHIQF